MKVIITGANGFIGSNLVKKFFNLGYDVISIVKDKTENIKNIESYSEIVYSNFSNMEQLFIDLKKIICNEECLFYHLAWIGVNGLLKSNYDSQLQNIKIALDCAMLSKKLNCKRYLIAGTVAENACDSFANLNELSSGLMYSVSKKSTRLFIDILCKNIKLPFVWMQFSNIFGPTNKTGNLISYTLMQLNSNKKAEFGPGLQPYDFIYIDDLIEAIYRLGVTKTLRLNYYFIGSGKPRLLKEYLIDIGIKMNKLDLITFGARPDDGIKYSFEMFDITNLINDIGNYISMNFDDAIRYTIENF